jgi:glycosyltransferase involved in cell wall biosynthesis
VEVLFLCCFDDNPYQQELADALADQGVAVRKGDHTEYLPILGRLRNGRPDVVHLHWLDNLLVSHNPVLSVLLGLRLLVELVVCRLLGIGVVWTVHNVLDHERSQPRLELRFRKLAARVCDTLVVHSDCARGRVVDAYDLPTGGRGPAVVVVPHGHFLDSYPDEVSRETAREWLGVGDETVYLFFGNIRPYKGVEGLVRAFKRLDGDVRLFVVGRPLAESNADDRLRTACAEDDRIETVFEFVPEEDIQRYMNAADALVLPFEEVLTSGSAILGMSFGRAVVAPRLGCLPDVLSETPELLYDPDDPDGLHDALRRAREADLEAAGRRNFEKIREYDWNGIAARTRAVYEDATGLSRGTRHATVGAAEDGTNRGPNAGSDAETRSDPSSESGR